MGPCESLMSDEIDNLIDKVLLLKAILVQTASGKRASPLAYSDLWADVTSHPLVQAVLPPFLRDCPTLPRFSHFIRYEERTLQGRLALLESQFKALFDFLARAAAPPGLPVAPRPAGPEARPSFRPQPREDDGPDAWLLPSRR